MVHGAASAMSDSISINPLQIAVPLLPEPLVCFYSADPVQLCVHATSYSISQISKLSQQPPPFEFLFIADPVSMADPFPSPSNVVFLIFIAV